MKLTCSHKFIENPSICGTIWPENLLNADKRTQDSDRERDTSQNRVGQKKEGKKKERKGETKQIRTCAPGKELVKEKKKTKKQPTLHPGKSHIPVRRPAETEEELL